MITKTTVLKFLTCLMLFCAMSAYADEAPERLYLVGNVNGNTGFPDAEGNYVEFKKTGNTFTIPKVEISNYTYNNTSVIFFSGSEEPSV